MAQSTFDDSSRRLFFFFNNELSFPYWEIHHSRRHMSFAVNFVEKTFINFVVKMLKVSTNPRHSPVTQLTNLFFSSFDESQKRLAIAFHRRKHHVKWKKVLFLWLACKWNYNFITKKAWKVNLMMQARFFFLLIFSDKRWDLRMQRWLTGGHT